MDKLTVYITVQFFSVDGSIRTPQSFLTVEFGRERIHDMMEAGGRGGGVVLGWRRRWWGES